MLIAGRAVQGMGSGGINSMCHQFAPFTAYPTNLSKVIVDVIISDLVPLRERGNYMSFVLMVYFVGMALGPYVGGAFAGMECGAWVFWINLPVSEEHYRVEDLEK